MRTRYAGPARSTMRPRPSSSTKCPWPNERSEVAQAEHLDQVVFHSVIHPDIAELLIIGKSLGSRILRTPGLPVTVLRPSHYMQNVLDFWDFFGAGLLPYPTSPDSRMGAWSTSKMIAAAAANVLITPREHMGKTYDLSTVELTRHDMAKIWSRVLGHRMVAVRIPPQSLTNPLVAVDPSVLRSPGRC